MAKYIVNIPGYSVLKITQAGAVLSHHEVGGVQYAGVDYATMHAINKVFEQTVHTLNALGDVKVEEKKKKAQSKGGVYGGGNG